MGGPDAGENRRSWFRFAAMVTTSALGSFNENFFKEAAMLVAIEERGDSKRLKEGAHHVLKGLEDKEVFQDDYDIIGILEDKSKHALLRATAAKIRVAM